MNDGSSQMFANWLNEQERNGSCSKTSEDFCLLTTETLLPESVQKWPTEVSSDGSGALYMRQKSEPLIDVTDGSALLPTPTARDYKDRGKGMNWDHAWKKRRLPGVVIRELYEDGKPS